MEESITAVVVSHLVRAASACGVDPATAFALVELQPATRHRFDVGVPLPRAEALAGWFGETLGADFGLRAAATGEHVSPLWFLATASETIADAIDVTIRYWPLVRTDYRWRVEVTPAAVRLVADTRPTTLGQAVLLQFDVASLCLAARSLAGPPACRLSVALPTPPPQQRLRPRNAPWGSWSDAAYDWPRAEIVIPREVSHRPIASHDPTLAHFLELQLDRQLSQQDGIEPFARQVGETLRVLQGRADRAEIANTLGVSERTLNRRLAAEGTSFRDLLDATRFELAAGWLADHSVRQVALRLGFSGPRAFRRAFERWAGCSPAAWRERSPPVGV